MKRLVIALGLLCALPAWAQFTGTWFAIQSDPIETDIDVAELNLDGVGARGGIKLMELRVNLKSQRTMADGETYESYFSHIAIDCKSSGIFHIDQRRFTDAKWQGPSTFQQFTDKRPMAFGGFLPSPKALVLRAACPK